MTGATIRRPVTLRGVDPRRFELAETLLAPAVAGSGVVINGVRAGTRSADVFSHTVRVGRIALVEHLLAACSGLGVTDLAVSVKGRSLPLLDGSALPWVRALERAGLRRAGTVSPLRLRRSVNVSEGNSVIVALPADRLAVTCLALALDGSAQTVSWRAGSAAFERELAPARTFGPVRGGARQAAKLNLRFGLTSRGGMLTPARARLPHEACRHKILDLVGDLALLGRPLYAELFAICPGHRLNLALARALVRQTEV